MTDDRAFVILVRASQHANVKLRDIAGQLVESGDLAFDEGRARSLSLDWKPLEAERVIVQGGEED